ncbi:SpoIIE family protein phosphatase [Methylicorpusculum sp.]|uniref:SpoIIE family protein phosphatase n=1 Tax=Methylicorpusculum sp. TaxID=2713644 RepID=UPI002720E3F7|nr:SpoIIE family protein phosphatase [Methylicorpusculum sp.]MDO8844839.1 SpoIIE family protein phosphatase [Methylicorpusculum sp.]
MAVKIGYATRPFQGESDCGDQCGWWTTGSRILMAVADGLGHGPEAAKAATAAINGINDHLGYSCEEIFEQCNKRLHDTRGAALALAMIEPEANRMTIGSVGNIRVVLIGKSRTLRFGATRGIVGSGYSKLIFESISINPGEVLAMFSDGLNEDIGIHELLDNSDRSSLDEAQAILDRWAKPEDDAAVLIYRYESFAALNPV